MNGHRNTRSLRRRESKAGLFDCQSPRQPRQADAFQAEATIAKPRKVSPIEPSGLICAHDWRRFFRNSIDFLKDLEKFLFEVALVLLLVMGLIYVVREATIHLWSNPTTQLMPLRTLGSKISDRPRSDTHYNRGVTNPAEQSSHTYKPMQTHLWTDATCHRKCNCTMRSVTSRESR